MTHSANYKTLPGGSIDYAHYDRKARAIRSADTHRNLHACSSWTDGFGIEFGNLRRVIPTQRGSVLTLMLPLVAGAVRGLFSSPEV